MTNGGAARHNFGAKTKWAGTSRARSYSGSGSTENSHILLTPTMRLCELNPYKKRRVQNILQSVSLISDVCVDEILVQHVGQEAGHTQQFVIDEVAPSPALRGVHKCKYCQRSGTSQGEQYFLLHRYTCGACDKTICPALSVCSQCYEVFFPTFHCATCHTELDF